MNEKNKKTRTKVNDSTIILPCGKMCGYCCCDCYRMDLNYTNSYGEAWCSYYSKYYSPSSDISGCSGFSQR